MIMLYRDKSWLKKKYLKEGLSLREIAELAGVSYVTIRDWLKRFGIPVRKKNDFRKMRMTVEEAMKVLTEPVGGFISQDEFEKRRAELWGRTKLRERRELAAQLKRERLDMDKELIGDWHRGTAEEQMNDIQRLADTVEDRDREKPVKATQKEKQYLERS